MLEKGEAMEKIRFAGCWTSEKAMSAYLQEAESAATLLSLSRRQVASVQSFLAQTEVLVAPPAVPARALRCQWILGGRPTSLSEPAKWS
jgi:hypothetical protein